MMLRLMLADDEQYERDYLEKVIKESYPTLLNVVCKASSGKELLEAAEVSNPQIILLDIKMPQMDGLETAEQIRKIYPDVQIVIVSAYSDFEYAKQAMKLGISEYLLKPYLDSELKAVLDRVIIRIREWKDTLSMLSYSGDEEGEYSNIFDKDKEKDFLWKFFFKKSPLDKKIFLEKGIKQSWVKVVVISTSVLSYMGDFSKEVLENYFCIQGVTVFNTIWMKQMVICLCSNEKESFSEINSCIRRARNYLVQEHNIPVVCGVSGAYYGVEFLDSAYEEASSFILQFSEQGEKTEFIKQTEKMKTLCTLEDDIIQSMKSEDREKCQEQMKTLVEILEECLDYHDISVKLNFGRSLLTILRGVNSNEGTEIPKEEIVQKLRKLEQLNFNGENLKYDIDFFAEIHLKMK